jgi:hypothetical protein
VPAPKKYRNTTPFLFNAELDMLNELREVCRKENKSVQEKLNELIIHEVETAGIGENNPLGITYGPAVQQKITQFNAANPLETLDLFLDNSVIGLKQWQPAFAEIQDQERMNKYVNLASTIHTAAKDRLSFLKTGKGVVRIGNVQRPVPQMKGTRSGF